MHKGEGAATRNIGQVRPGQLLIGRPVCVEKKQQAGAEQREQGKAMIHSEKCLNWAIYWVVAE